MFITATVIRTISLAAVVIPAIGAAQQPTTNTSPSVSVVQMGEAKITTSGYPWTPLAGVIVEIQAPVGETITCDRSSVTAKTRDGKTVPAAVLFVTAGSDNFEGKAMANTQMAGLGITVAKETFQAYTSMMTMAMILEEGGGGKYTFRKAGILKIGFLFREDIEKLASISVANREVKLILDAKP